MQGSLQRMINNVKAEKRSCVHSAEISLLLYLAIVPVCAFGSDGLFNFNSYIFAYTSLYIAVYVVIAVSALLFSVRLFRDMHSFTHADVMLSLPMTAKERYFSKILTYLRCIILPYIICGVVSTAAVIASDHFIFEHSDAFITYLRGMFVFFFVGLAVLMFVGAVSFICSVMSNSSGEAVFTSVFTVGSGAVVPMLFYELMQYAAQIEFDSERFGGYSARFFFGLGPVEFMYRLTEDWNDTLWKQVYGTLIAGTAVSILISALLMLSGFLVYRRRDRATLAYNNAAKPFLMFVVGISGIAAILYAANNRTAYIPYAVLICGLLAYGFLLKRNGFEIKRCKRWLAGYAGVICGFIALSAVMYFTEGFGLSGKPCYLTDSGTYCCDLYTEGFHEPEYSEFRSVFGMSRSDIDDLNKIVSDHKADVRDTDSFCGFIGLKMRDWGMYTADRDYPIYQPEDCDLMFVSFIGEEPETAAQNTDDGDAETGYDRSIAEYENMCYYIRIKPDEITGLWDDVKQRFGDRAIQEIVHYDFKEDQEGSEDEEDLYNDTEEEFYDE